MKAITTIFESILGSDESIVWTPADGPTSFVGEGVWEWGKVSTSTSVWEWGR